MKYPDSNGDGGGTSFSYYIHVFLMAGEYDDTLEWPFQGVVTLELLNQLDIIGNCWYHFIKALHLMYYFLIERH